MDLIYPLLVAGSGPATVSEHSLALTGVSNQLPPKLRAPLRTLFCDSKASVYEMSLAHCSLFLVTVVGKTVGRDLAQRFHGHCGIFVRSENGHEIEVPPEGCE